MYVYQMFTNMIDEYYMLVKSMEMERLWNGLLSMFELCLENTFEASNWGWHGQENEY
jgi:hypothetical protein